MDRRLAKDFQDLLVWQKAHQFVLSMYRLELMSQLGEVSKILEAYTSSILDTGS